MKSATHEMVTFSDEFRFGGPMAHRQLQFNNGWNLNLVIRVYMQLPYNI